ncbi:MAG: twin-arginine translocase subunit TatC [Clostridium sp.]|nr:twin-arginine translocase subunit TatC [Clostridium sp.]
MSFWDHVEALRGVLLRAGGVVVLFTIFFFAIMSWFFDRVIMAPCDGSFPLYRFFETLSGRIPGFPAFEAEGFHVELINIRLASQFFIHMSVSFWLGLAAAFPVIIYLLWNFIRPALYSSEKRGMRTAFLLGNIMFYIGVAVGYFVVFPLTLRFLAEYQVSEIVPNQISLDSYIDNFIALILTMGVVFELPLLAWLLGLFGLLKRGFFRKYRRQAVVVLLILAAVITPTGDPFTLMVVFLPLYMLWEFSALLVPKRAKEPDSEAEDSDSGDGSVLAAEYIPSYRRRTPAS